MPNFISSLKNLIKKEKHKKQLNDNEIHNKIGQLLFNIAPMDAIKIYLKAEVSLENDHCKLVFYYSDHKGKEKPIMLTDDSSIDDEVFSELIKLKQYTIDNNLTNGHPIWIGCIVTVDIENSKINIEFKYEPFIEEV
ncbi:DUF600 family protein [Orbaceae bacterium ac157xtp]